MSEQVHFARSDQPVTDTASTVNNSEIRRPTESLKFEDFGSKVAELGLSGSSPAERVAQLRAMNVEDVAGMLDELNMSLQGSAETLLAPYTQNIGEQIAIPVEYRYDVFEKIMDIIKQAPADINPARVGDALGLMVVMLHPFKDGNGRTARAVGYIFQPDFDTPDQVEDIAYYVQSREAARKKGEGKLPIGYAPTMPEGMDQTNPSDVIEYFRRLIMDENDNTSYKGTFLRSPRKAA